MSVQHERALYSEYARDRCLMRGSGCGGSSGGGSYVMVCGGGGGGAANPLRPMKYNRRERWHTATADRQLYFYAHTLHAGNVYKGVAACQKLPYFICLIPITIRGMCVEKFIGPFWWGFFSYFLP